MQATPNWETFFGAADAKYDRATHQATKKLKEIEDVGPDQEDEADQAVWEKLLREEVEARFTDIDFSMDYISIPSRPLTPSSSPMAVVPLLPTPRTTRLRRHYLGAVRRRLPGTRRTILSSPWWSCLLRRDDDVATDADEDDADNDVLSFFC